MEYKLFPFQKETQCKIIEHLGKYNMVILKSQRGNGKSTLIKTLNLDEYETILIKGTIQNRNADFQALKTSKLLPAHRKHESKIKGAVKVVIGISSFFANVKLGLPVSDFSSPVIDEVFNLYDDKKMGDIELIIRNIEEATQNILLIIDEVDLLDLGTFYILLYLVRLNKTNLKILFVFEDEKSIQREVKEFQAFIEREYSPNIVLMEKLKETDLKELNISDEKLSSSNIFPLSVLLTISESDVDLEADYLNQKISNIFTKESDEQEISQFFRLIVIYQHEFVGGWLHTNSITHICEKVKLNPKYFKRFIDEGILIKNDDNNSYIKIDPIYYEHVLNQIKEFSNENSTYRIIDYIERNAPFLYLDKFIHYKEIGYSEIAGVNAFLYFSEQVRKGIWTEKEFRMLEYLNSEYSSLPIQMIREIYTNYFKEDWGKAYAGIKSLLDSKDLLHQIYSYDIEILCELISIKYLLLSRYLSCCNGIERWTVLKEAKYILSDKNRQNIVSLIDLLKNNAIKLQLEEAILHLSNSYADNLEKKDNDDEATKKIAAIKANIKTEFKTLFISYQKEFSKTNVMYSKFWRVKMGIFLSKISLIGINDSEVLERAYFIIKSERIEHPKYYLKCANNFSGILFWQSNYNESKQILLEAKKFIAKYSTILDWGIIEQMYVIMEILSSTQNSHKKILEEYIKLYNNPVVENRMHEKFICEVNLSIFEILLGEFDSAEKRLLVLSDKEVSEEYDKYLIYTNLGAVQYMKKKYKEAIESELHAKSIIKSKIPYLDNDFLKERSEMLIKIYFNKTVIAPLDMLKSTNKTGKIGHNNQNYNRLVFFSDISYWSD